MGTWGTGISSNDSYDDVHDDFFELYNDGLDVREITARLINENQEDINTPDYAPNFWFALANAQWECCALDEEVKSKAENLIQSGEDLRIWKESGASPADLKAREKVLEKFLIKLSAPKDKPRKRVKKKLYNSIFKRGDCLTYVMDNGNYGGAFVLTEEDQSPAGVNYIAITTIDQPNKPTDDDFFKAFVHMQRRHDVELKNNKFEKISRDRPDIYGYSALTFKNDFAIEVIGKLTILKDYVVELQSASPWFKLKTTLPFNNQFTEINGAPASGLKLTDLIGKKTFLQRLFGK